MLWNFWSGEVRRVKTVASALLVGRTGSVLHLRKLEDRADPPRLAHAAGSSLETTGESVRTVRGLRRRSPYGSLGNRVFDTGSSL